MKMKNFERTALFKILVRHLGCYQGSPTSKELERMAEIRGRMLLIIRMRWILLVTVCAYGLSAGSLLFSSHPDYSAGISLLVVPVGTLLAATAYNLFYHLFYQELSHFVLVNHIQIFLDILATTILIHSCGGIFSPFWAIYPFLILEASLLLERRRDTWLFCLAAILAFGILSVAETGEYLKPAASSLVSGDLQKNPLDALLQWSWTAGMIVAMTLISSHVVQVNRTRESILKQLTVKDQMTKLYNRSYFFKELNSEIQRSIRYGHTFSIVFLDIDHFKEFNDTFGHLEGDRLLKELAGILRRNVRRRETNPPYDIDVPCRYGGEEFGIILPETPVSACGKEPLSQGEMSAAAFAERIRKEIECMPVEDTGITVSIGIAAYPQHGTTPDGLVKAADDALYQAKKTGKNRIVIAGQKPELKMEYHHPD
ncbi:MAG: GGDEF domain-containing protein [Deltaproteobacteria bacterium]|nr:GGDEF domain-containing protein [Deltaproteobacteria bacterium]